MNFVVVVTKKVVSNDSLSVYSRNYEKKTINYHSSPLGLHYTTLQHGLINGETQSVVSSIEMS